jgi:hypothetical protein
MDEVQNLLIRVQGEMDMKRLNKELEQGNALLEKLMKMQAQGVDKKASIIAIAKNQLDRHQELDSIAKDLATKIPKGSSFNTQGMQQLGYALQDFTSASGGWSQKLNAITNNLQMVAASMGVTGPMFLAITGGITAIQLFISNYDRIDAYLKGLPSPEEMKAKADKKAAEQADFEAIVKAPKPQEAAAAGRARDAIAEIGGPKVVSGLEQSLAGSVSAWTVGEQTAWRVKHMHEYPGGLFGKELTTAMKNAEGPARAAVAKEEVKRLLTEVVKPGQAGISAQRRIREIMAANPGQFSKADLEAVNNITATLGDMGTNVPAPDMDEAHFANLQRQLEEKEGRGGKVIEGGPLGVGVMPGIGPQASSMLTSHAPGKSAREQKREQAAQSANELRQQRQRDIRSGQATPLGSQVPLEQQAMALNAQASDLQAQLQTAAPGRDDQIMGLLLSLQQKMYDVQRKMNQKDRQSHDLFGPTAGGGTMLPSIW